jgi:DNA-directed RNA polymerase specialized sigma24 family protein
MSKNVVEKIRRLLLYYDLTIAYALGEIEVRKNIMNLYRGDDRKPSQRKFVQAKIDAERFEIYAEEVLKAKKELEKNLLFVLNRYTEHYKQVFWLHCIEGKTYDEISSKTGYSYEAVKKIVHKVKDDIISYFDDEEKPVEPKKRGRKKKAE